MGTYLKFRKINKMMILNSSIKIKLLIKLFLVSVIEIIYKLNVPNYINNYKL